MEDNFKEWLLEKYPTGGTASSRFSNCCRIEKSYGNLDDIYNIDRCKELMENLTYTKEMQKNNIEVKHKINIDGNKFTGTATLRNAVNLYIEYKSLPNNVSKKNIKKKTDNNIEIKDSYQIFFNRNYLTIEQFFDFGLTETIFANIEKAKEEWERLKKNIFIGEIAYIRGFGRDGAGTKMFLDFYKDVFDNKNIRRDSTNNAEPTKVISRMTNYSKVNKITNTKIVNYQIAHVFGKTKNVFAFGAPWNIVYTPKIIDPFTGHEAIGSYVLEYQELFKKKAYDRFKPLIEEFNEIITAEKYQVKIENYLVKIKNKKEYSEKDIKKFRESLIDEFEPIII